ncbi:Beta-barrel assembly machine subunit BamD [Paraperlucidibaca baekdonensis]|uniref:Outer membrane protein assembly factor BamD n=1 Tax=Paraperlucidibaca baekdonensis TaxID=748120 RepID=A0A3E0HA92_9GAMM|nr:outer membrane protein assembly factor BamD [Paraperlucidibaca baekdonensis]REH40563.1 Beta-barrel assembly machine subunit BamD [Paraperlucidibaca baekdonensis]
MKKLSRLALAAAAVIVTACAAQKPIVKTEADYYNEAHEALKDGNYSVAVAGYEALESQYPVGNFTEQAQLELIYGRHMQGDYASAIAAIDRYLRLHPESANLDYVLYLRGLSNYAIDQDAILKRLPVNMAHRDMGQARVAFDDFRQLITRYPNSQYNADARQRMVYLRNQFAEAELHVARYYETRGAYVAVINRARWVVENYPESQAVPEALSLLVKNYTALGMTDLAAQAKALLRSNTPKKAG